MNDLSRKQLLALLRKTGACSDAVEWLKNSDHGTLAEAWAACERADWMLWFAGRNGVDRATLVNAACDCAETALPYWERKYPDDRRPHDAIMRARQYVAGECDLEALRRARRAAYAYAAAAYAAADAAAYAAADAAAAAAAAARKSAHRKMADLVRKRITVAVEVAP